MPLTGSKVLARLLSILLLGGSAVTSMAAECTFDDPAQVVRIDGEPLTLRAVEQLEQLPVRGGRKLSRAVLVSSLVDNRLVARQAAAELGEAALYQSSATGFDRRYLIEQRIAGVFRTLFQSRLDAFIQDRAGGRLSNLVDDRIEPNLARIREILTPRQRLREELDEEQRAQAERLILAQFRFPDMEPRSFSLWDIYSSQNIQNRMRMHQGDLTALVEALDQQVAAAFVQAWVRRESGLSEQDILWIERYVTDGQFKQVFLNSRGLALDLHSDNPALDRVRERLSQDEIRAYYDAHKEQFRRLVAVRARHIRLPDEATAEKAHQAIQSGMSFDEAVRRFSIAEDRDQDPPGNLGRLDLTRDKGWLEAVTGALKPGRVSRPIRAPAPPGQEAHWEIFLVEGQETGYYEPDSETVRYLAGRALASRKLVEEYQALRESLYNKAEICINTRLVALTKEGIMKTSSRESVGGGL